VVGEPSHHGLGCGWAGAVTAGRAGLVAAVSIATLGAVAMRVHNAFALPLAHGFDAEGNWQYIQLLLESWRLPTPEQGWSTSHPPLFYYGAAAILRVGGVSTAELAFPAIRLLTAAAGIAVAALAAALTWRIERERPSRAVMAGVLVLYLPVAIQLSAMLSEELWSALFISAAIAGAAWLSTQEEATPATVLAVGLAGGCAALTKLSGWLAVAGVALALAIEGWRRRRLRPWLLYATLAVVVAAVVAGWYYGWNWIERGYLYPHALDVHALMQRMPPGERTFVDYLRVPLATWLRPDLLAPDLLHSVWGSTYVTVWFDGHRHFLPRDAAHLGSLATALLVLGLVPTLAFADGLRRGIARWMRGPRTADGPLLLLTGLTLAGYVAFTWRNPWFAAVKGSYLLGLAVPFGFYASESLDAVARRGRATGMLVAVGLAVWVLLVGAVFTQGLVFETHDGPGLPWLQRGRP